MKVQIDVNQDLWKHAKASAAMRGETLGELVEVAVGELVGWEQGTSTNGDAQRGVAKARSKNVKVTLDVTSESKSPAPSPQPPVVVSAPNQPASEFLCKVCGKPTKGEFLCPTCKKL